MKNNRMVLSVCLLTMAAAGVGTGQVAQSGPIADGTSGGAGPQSAYKVLYSFTSGADGGYPNAGGSDAVLVRDSQGNLYGTATTGGLNNNNCPGGCGVVFKVDPSGKETVLHAFGGPPDGSVPAAGLIMDGEGNMYGTTVLGGASTTLAAGTVFKIDRNGKYKVLYSFSGPDGSGPYASVTRDIWGNLYGTTVGGGEFCVQYGGCGVIFKLDPSGKETILHSFSGPDGNSPLSNLILDEWGNIYGTALDGGSSGKGVVFKIDPKGNERVLHSFTNGEDGGLPGDLVRDPAGNLYGVTWSGGYFGADFGGFPCGPLGGCGVIYKLDPSDKFSVFHTFEGGDDGSTPYTSLLWSKGHLYGTTFFGGAYYSSGSIFEMDATGKETVLYLFTDGLDGGNPYAGLVADSQGNLYGTTGYGGASISSPDCAPSGCGVVFELHHEPGANGERPAGQDALPAVTRNQRSYQRRPLAGSGQPGPWVAKP